jgi:hypothetical protein
MLRNFTSSYRSRSFNPGNVPSMIEAFEKAMLLDLSGESIEQVISKSHYDIGNSLIVSGAFDMNPGFNTAKEILIRKYTAAHPERTFVVLRDNPDLPFRDSLIMVAAYKHPRLLYDYAAANNKIGIAIRKIDDPLVQTVVKMASSNSGQLYFPFLDNILKGNQTLEEIDKVKGDDVKYYKLLVKTRIDYVSRSLNKEKVYEMDALNYMLGKRAKDVFIKTINALHNDPDHVRFRILNQLTAQELYYLAVNGESDIYTSSYTRGVYPMLMQKIGNRGDSLLVSVNFDRFKKFIKMAAGFNTLSNFLNSFPNQDQAESLMTAFVNGIERSPNLEDGVDVADSYASISETMKPMAAKMLQNVKANLDRTTAQNNRRGMIMYNLLYKLFLSADSTMQINLSQEFGIPPVYNIAYQDLLAEEKAVMQVFFYGDEDGRSAYQGFVRQFSNANYQKTETKHWVMFASTKGKPVLVFANKPLPEESNQDAEAQEVLNNYLQEKNLSPTIVVHRGHSYYADYTIKQLPPSAKIVFLGSCGGYHLIHDVLRNAPDAHIIASKQIGKTVINQPFINLLVDKMRNGNNIDWIPFWSEFKRSAGSVEGFDDYIPPHKNLGAIFIKAYKIQTGEDPD